MERLYTREDADCGEGLFDSVAWVLEIIGVADTHPFKSAVAHGVNEDSPTRVDFYMQAEPTVYDVPEWVWTVKLEE